MTVNKVKLSSEHIKAIENVLSCDNPVELIPTKDGLKLYELKREKIKIGVTGESR